MSEIEMLFKEFIGEDAIFVSGIILPAIGARTHRGKKFRATNAKLKMSFTVNGKHHRVVIERFPDVMADQILGQPLEKPHE